MSQIGSGFFATTASSSSAMLLVRHSSGRLALTCLWQNLCILWLGQLRGSANLPPFFLIVHGNNGGMRTLFIILGSH